MRLYKYKPLFFLSILAILAYIAHKTVFFILKIDDTLFVYPIETLYIMFYGMSFIIFMILLKVKEVRFDSVGMTFMLITSIKLIFCYLILKPILQTKTIENSIEKIDFFMTFILFLTIETVLTIRILNEKQ